MSLFGKKKPNVEEEEVTFVKPAEIFSPVPTTPQQPIVQEPPKAEKVSVKFMQPVSYKEAQRVVEKLKAGSIVVIDLSHLSGEESTIFRTYLAGASFALDAKSEKSGENMLTVAPKNVDMSSISSDDEEDF